MPVKRNQHVVPHQRGWAVKPAGGERATSVHPTPSAAIPAMLMMPGADDHADG